MTLLWHDDCRPPINAGWTWARTNEAAKEILLNSDVTFISMDHDLGMDWVDPSEPIADLDYMRGQSADGCGCELARWMCEEEIFPETIRVHSMNPAGAADILSVFTTYMRVTGIDRWEGLYAEPFNPNWRNV